MNYPKKVEVATKLLIEQVGICLELIELDPENKEWYEGYRDAVVVLIGETTGNDVNVVRRELTLKIKEYLMETHIEETFADDDPYRGYKGHT